MVEWFGIFFQRLIKPSHGKDILAGFIAGFVFATIYKTPNYVEVTQDEWEKPNFDTENDPFMKRFDENGNFVNLPKPDENVEEEGFLRITYEYKEQPKE